MENAPHTSHVMQERRVRERRNYTWHVRKFLGKLWFLPTLFVIRTRL